MQRAQEIAARHYEIPGSQRIAVSADSLLHWARCYRQGGFEALVPQPRQDRGTFRAITPHLAEWIERLKRENPTDHHLSQHLEELPPSSFAPGFFSRRSILLCKGRSVSLSTSTFVLQFVTDLGKLNVSPAKNATGRPQAEAPI